MAGTDENTIQDENPEQNVNESQEQIEEDNQISEAVAAEIGIFENEIKNRREVWETGRDDTIIWSYIYDSFNKKNNLNNRNGEPENNIVNDFQDNAKGNELQPNQNQAVEQNVVMQAKLKEEQELKSVQIQNLSRTQEKRTDISGRERQKYEYKDYIRILLELYKPYISGDPSMKRLEADILSYINMNATGSNGVYDDELKLLNRITDDIEQLNYSLEKQADELGSEYGKLPDIADENELTDEQKKRYEELNQKERELDKKTKISADFHSFFLAQTNGALWSPEKNDGNGEKYVIIDGTKNPLYNGKNIKYVSKKDVPLFPHEPNINDVRQGYLGDCYLLSALGYIAMNDPQQIRDMVRDNGDGTCTVRFFCGNYKNKAAKPLYVKVEKSIPGTRMFVQRQSEDCLWVQMIEKAYVLSGIHLHYRSDNNRVFFEAMEGYNPEKAEEYKKNPDIWKRMSVEERKRTTPWLFDDDGNLKEFKPDYMDIEGGESYIVTNALMGNGYMGEYLVLPARKYPMEFYDGASEKPDIGRIFKDLIRLEKANPMSIKEEGTSEHVDPNAKDVASAEDILLEKTGIKIENKSVGDSMRKYMLNRCIENFQNAFFLKASEIMKSAERSKDPKAKSQWERGQLVFMQDTLQKLEKAVYESFKVISDDFEYSDGNVNESAGEWAKDAKLRELLNSKQSSEPEIKDDEEDNDNNADNMSEDYFGERGEEKKQTKQYGFGKPRFSHEEMGRLILAMQGYCQKFYEKYNTRYTQEEIKFIKRIKLAIDKKQYVFSGTGLNAQSIAETHAYSIHDCAQTEDGRLMLYVRNPWGTSSGNGVIYEKKGNEFVRKTTKVKEGFFWIEMRDYLDEFRDVQVCGPEKSLNPEKEKKEFEKERKCFGNKIETLEILNELYDKLEASVKPGVKTIAAYRELKRELSQVRREISEAKDNSAEHISDILEPLSDACRIYLEEAKAYGHSDDVERMKLVSNVNRLRNIIDKNLNKNNPDEIVSVKEQYNSVGISQADDELSGIRQQFTDAIGPDASKGTLGGLSAAELKTVFDTLQKRPDYLVVNRNQENSEYILHGVKLDTENASVESDPNKIKEIKRWIALLDEQKDLSILAERAAMKDNSVESASGTFMDLERINVALDSATHWYNSSANYRSLQNRLAEAASAVKSVNKELSVLKLQELGDRLKKALEASQKYLTEKGASAEGFVPKNSYEERRVEIIKNTELMLRNKVVSIERQLRERNAQYEQAINKFRENAAVKENELKNPNNASEAGLVNALASVAGAALVSMERQLVNTKTGADEIKRFGKMQQMLLEGGEEKVIEFLSKTKAVRREAEYVFKNKKLSFEGNIGKELIGRLAGEIEKGKSYRQEAERIGQEPDMIGAEHNDPGSEAKNEQKNIKSI